MIRKTMLFLVAGTFIAMADSVVVEDIDKNVIEDIAIENHIRKEDTLFEHNKKRLVNYDKRVCIDYPMTLSHFAELLKIKQNKECQVLEDGNIPPQKGVCFEDPLQLQGYLNQNPESDISITVFVSGNRCTIQAIPKR